MQTTRELSLVSLESEISPLSLGLEGGRFLSWGAQRLWVLGRATFGGWLLYQGPAFGSGESKTQGSVLSQ